MARDYNVKLHIIRFCMCIQLPINIPRDIVRIWFITRRCFGFCIFYFRRQNSFGSIGDKNKISSTSGGCYMRDACVIWARRENANENATIITCVCALNIMKITTIFRHRFVYYFDCHKQNNLMHPPACVGALAHINRQ